MKSNRINVEGLNVFTFWNGDMEAAPSVVKAACQSWRRGCELGGYEYHIIGEANIEEWEGLLGEDGVKLKSFRENGRYVPDHKWRKYTDILRLLLLKHFNGIWVDSTVLLMKPFSDWLPDPQKFGGLQLPKHSGTMVIESWLLISLRHNAFVSGWADFFADYSLRISEDATQWRVRRYSIPWVMHRLTSKINGWSHQWFSEWFIRLYPRSPYYAIYYSFSLMWSLHSQSSGMEKYKVFLPYPLDAWSDFNGRQQIESVISDFEPAMLESLERLPFLKLCWRRSPDGPLSELPKESVLRYFWSQSIACLSKV